MHSDNKEPYEKPSDPVEPQEKHIVQDLRRRGCPVCYHMEEVVFAFLAKWQYALTYDEKAQQDYAAELGFCPAHTWQLAAIATPRGLSRAYPNLLEHIADRLSKLIGASPNLSDEIAALVKDGENCRVCRLLRDTENMYIRRLAAFLEREEARMAYACSDGVCLHHLSLLISFLTSQEVVQYLLSETVKNIKNTTENMRSYVLKHEALERHLISRDEQYAYLRALVYVAGARNVCAPHLMRM